MNSFIFLVSFFPLPCKYVLGKVSQCPGLGTMVFGTKSLPVMGLPEHCRLLSSSPGLRPLDASRQVTLSRTRLQMSPMAPTGRGKWYWLKTTIVGIDTFPNLPGFKSKDSEY